MPAVVVSGGPGDDFPAKLTGQVLVCSLLAACGGLMFGYDIGISGGVTSMDDFLEKFFPEVYIKKHRAKEDNYCKYDNEYLQLFTSSLYLAAIVASFVASVFCKKFGRRPTILVASIFFMCGSVCNMVANSLLLLIVGRLFLGLGVGFGNQAVPLFISEIAPTKYRGGLNICFQLLITVGILIASIVNYFTANIHPHGWRISLGLAAVPAAILLVGSLIIVETPTSLIERGKDKQGMETLKKIRGVDNVDKEVAEIVYATEMAKLVKHPYKELMKRKNRPPLICGTILQIFQQFTGINVIMFYAPVLFQTMGAGGSTSLVSAVVTNSVNTLSTLVAVFCVDKLGRRFLLLEAAVQMLITHCIVGGILTVHLKATNTMSASSALAVLIFICVFVSGFAWSWGPLGWLIPSETFTLDTRNAGFFFAVSMNMLCTFIIAQAFLSMLCKMRSAIFFFFAAWVVVMGLFVAVMLPETKGVPIDEMADRVWKKHWFWKRYFDEEDNKGTKEEERL